MISHHPTPLDVVSHQGAVDSHSQETTQFAPTSVNRKNKTISSLSDEVEAFLDPYSSKYRWIKVLYPIIATLVALSATVLLWIGLGFYFANFRLFAVIPLEHVQDWRAESHFFQLQDISGIYIISAIFSASSLVITLLPVLTPQPFFEIRWYTIPVLNLSLLVFFLLYQTLSLTIMGLRYNFVLDTVALNGGCQSIQEEFVTLRPFFCVDYVQSFQYLISGTSVSIVSLIMAIFFLLEQFISVGILKRKHRKEKRIQNNQPLSINNGPDMGDIGTQIPPELNTERPFPLQYAKPTKLNS